MRQGADRFVSVVVLLVIVLFAAGGFLLYEFGTVAMCDGQFPVTVIVKSTAAAPLTKVAYAVMPSEARAQEFIQCCDDPASIFNFKDVPGFDGSPFTVDVQHSVKSSPLGREWDYVQFEAIVLLLEFKNGKKVLEVAPIPSRGEPRTIYVTTDGIAH